LPYPPQLIFNQLPFSPEDSKPDIGSAEPTYSVMQGMQQQGRIMQTTIAELLV